MNARLLQRTARQASAFLLALAALCVGAPAFAQSAAITATSPASLNQGNLRRATVAVTLTSATYADGLTATVRFEVRVTRTSRTRWRGWRLIFLEPDSPGA